MKFSIYLTGIGVATAISCLAAEVSSGSHLTAPAPTVTPTPPASAYRITSYAGGTVSGDGGQATSVFLGSVDGLSSDSQGNVYLADSSDHRVCMVQPGGRITTIAGDGTPGLSGDSNPALPIRLNSPYGLAIGSAGNLFIADFGNGRVRKLSREGRITTIASGLTGPRNLVTDLAGNLYISDAPANRVYLYSAAGKLSILAGDGTAIALKFPAGLAVDYQGNLFIADTGTQSILRLAGGKAEKLATQPEIPGTPLALASDYYGRLFIGTSEGGLFTRNLGGALAPLLPDKSFKAIRAVHQDLAGNIYFSEPGRVWRISGLGTVSAFAGGSAPAPSTATDARIAAPIGVALDAAGNLYFADEETRRVWRIFPTGAIEAIAGTAEPPSSSTAAGDGGPAVSAPLFDPVAVAVSPQGEIAIAEFSAHRVRIILPNGVIFTAAGTGTPGTAGDNGPAQYAQLNKPRGLAYDSQGNLYVADSGNGLVRKLGRNGFLSTVGASTLDNPTSVAVDPAGVLYVAESNANAIRRLSAANTWELVTQGQLNFPSGLAFDSNGALYIADVYNHRIRRISPAGIAETIAGTSGPGAGGDNSTALQAQLNSPVSLAVDPQGRIFIADLDNHRIRLLTPESLTPPPTLIEPPPAAPVEPAQPTASETTIQVRHAATLKDGPYAPGQLVSIFGTGLVQAAEVRVNGRQVALSYASATQLNFALPAATTPDAVIELIANASVIARATIPLSPSAPGIFGPLPPAARGSVVPLYITGTGAGNLPLSLVFGSIPVDIVYVGDAPGAPGVTQLNVQLPGMFTAPGVYPVTLTSGPNASPAGVAIELR